MAKPKKEQPIKISDEAEQSQRERAESALKKLKALNPYASFIKDSALASSGGFIDTGCLVLNALISGDLLGGISDNKLTMFAGESTTGKTLLALKAARNAQKKRKIVLWIDSEFALTESSLINFGLDPDLVIYMPVKSIETCRNTLVNFLRHIEEEKAFGEYFIVIDSLANMESEGEDKKIAEDKGSPDMGAKARACGSLLRNLNNWCGFTQTGCVITNHIIDNPGDTMAKYNPVKPQPGGKKVMYIPSTSIQLTKSGADEDDSKNEVGGSGAELTPGQKKYKGQYITALTIKNRFVKPFMTASMYLDFEKGLHRYSGLAELAKTMGAVQTITPTSTVYEITSTKERIGISSAWSSDEEILEKLIEPLNEIIREKWAYKKEEEETMSEDVEDDVPSHTVLDVPNQK